MSEENVRLFLESSEAFNSGDIEKWLKAFDPECIFEPQVAVVDGAFEGHAGLRAFSRTFGDIYEVFEVQFDAVRDLGDRVMALGTGVGVGKGSGIRAGATTGDRRSIPERSGNPLQGLRG